MRYFSTVVPTFIVVLCLLLGVVTSASSQNSEQKPTQEVESMPSIVSMLLNNCGHYDFPLEYGRWGEPEEVFTLPTIAAGGGYYYPDIQASFPGVDWQNVDRLYIPAGHYKFIRIGNLPDRDAQNPLVITNTGGQVRVGGLGHYYLFVVGGGKNWVITGRYDPVSQTGDSNYKGHWRGSYANSRDTYGFLVDDEFVRESVSGLSVGGRASDFEIEFVEIRQVGFAGMVLKTDDDGTATMANVKVHDTYIHDTLSEGYYIGSTQSQPQHQVRNLELYNNRVIRSGTEAIQVGNLGGNTKIYNNVFALSAVHWKDAFQPWQDGNLQLGNRAGDVTIENNIFIGAAGNLVFASAQQIAGDSYPVTSTVRFRNNYFSSTRNLFFYIRNDEFPGVQYILQDNYFTHMDFQRDELDSKATAPQEMIRTFTPASLEFLDNIWNVDLNFSNPLHSGNGTNKNVSGSGNITDDPPQLGLCEPGLPTGFDYLKLEVWTATAGRGGGAPVSYEQGDIVMHLGIPYLCLNSTCASGMVPPDNPGIWQQMPYFPDDWRLEQSSSFAEVGLLY